ncbi:GspH/FimT family pseudopilin [Pseudomonas sp. DTU_2021_1001937_2_SI_NGA_ILE_001]|uniref:GspH/FimT family pseudopilin n=1 Tax=Pseudomonas sp. DTU_2021_1001937_2_SI_NGA_ILE_001 TaxID=3077589 RepID=UPI0028FC2E89|nr:GspH/FimT family pseudopilin [Pseudomonas sp. DTU_2021_1001937_2_SI_NGA_ILE_001]WNW11955.1 GspH/FimT family pseudopilin [Pseudomonas sp. DTU_2021_1001937_2_SI_NGA_ILE_001]
MRHHAKAFTLVELLVTVSLVGILAAIAIPSFSSSIQNNRAETEVSELQRALNYTRLEAINRGITLRIAPVSGSDWTTALQVTDPTNSNNPAIRNFLDMSSGAAINTGNVAAIDFNNLGGVSSPANAVTMTYTRGSITRTLTVCLTGRIVLNGNCNA